MLSQEGGLRKGEISLIQQQPNTGEEKKRACLHIAKEGVCIRLWRKMHIAFKESNPKFFLQPRGESVTQMPSHHLTPGEVGVLKNTDQGAHLVLWLQGILQTLHQIGFVQRHIGIVHAVESDHSRRFVIPEGL